MSDTANTTAGQNDGVQKVAELMKGIRTAMLTTVDDDGHLVSRPMAVQEVEFDGDLWFFSGADARKVDQIRHGARVNVAFASGSSWVSIAGNAEVLRDVAKAKELWNSFVEAWFPNGPEHPDVVLVKVHADTAEYWDSPGGRVATLLSLVKSKITGDAYDGGENEVVDL